jgi:5-methyltetrahydrofolate--homocysteine methyltransferase
LLIGGATTSPAHTAVKIAPEYPHGVVHVLDASRVVNVVSSLLSPEQKPAFLAGNIAKQELLRSEFAARRQQHKLLPLAEARARRTPIDWATADIPRPEFFGTRVFSSEVLLKPQLSTFNHLERLALDEIVRYIDWGPFFSAWEISGRYPDLLTDAKVGVEATKLFNDAQKILARVVAEKRFTAKAVIGFWPANAAGDDIEVYADEQRSRRNPPVKTTTRSRTTSLRAIAVGLTTSAASPSQRVTESKRSRPSSRRSTTIIPRSWRKHWATASPKRSPN